MLDLRICILCFWCIQTVQMSDGGLAASAVGNGYAFSTDGRRAVAVDGLNGPSADSLGNGMATASDGRRLVLSYKGDKLPANNENGRLKKLRKGRKMGHGAFAGSGFNPFHMVGLPDPRRMLGN